MSAKYFVFINKERNGRLANLRWEKSHAILVSVKPTLGWSRCETLHSVWTCLFVRIVMHLIWPRIWFHAIALFSLLYFPIRHVYLLSYFVAKPPRDWSSLLYVWKGDAGSQEKVEEYKQIILYWTYSANYACNLLFLEPTGGLWNVSRSRFKNR